MFGVGKRDERAVEAVREEMTAADTRARAVLANAMAHIESRLSIDHEETARLQASTQAAIENLRYEVSSRPADIGPVLEQVAAMCALVAERLEADRLERRTLTEAITLLARPGLAEGPSRVLGGLVMASPEISVIDHPGASGTAEIEPIEGVEPIGAPATIDLTAGERDTDEPASGTEIWNAFEPNRVEPVAGDEALDVRPRRGTRLTAARRSNAGVSYR